MLRWPNRQPYQAADGQRVGLTRVRKKIVRRTRKHLELFPRESSSICSADSVHGKTSSHFKQSDCECCLNASTPSELLASHWVRQIVHPGKFIRASNWPHLTGRCNLQCWRIFSEHANGLRLKGAKVSWRHENPSDSDIPVIHSCKKSHVISFQQRSCSCGSKIYLIRPNLQLNRPLAGRPLSLGNNRKDFTLKITNFHLYFGFKNLNNPHRRLSQSICPIGGHSSAAWPSPAD